MRRRVPKKLSASKWSFTARVTTIFPEKIFGENVTAECKFAHGLPGINTQIDYPSSGRLLISLVFLACCSTAFPRWKNYFILFFAGQRYRHVGGGRGRRSNAPSMYFLKLSLILCQTEMIQNFIYLQCFDNGTLLVPLKFEQANLTVTEAANVSFLSFFNKICFFTWEISWVRPWQWPWKSSPCPHAVFPNRGNHTRIEVSSSLTRSLALHARNFGLYKFRISSHRKGLSLLGGTTKWALIFFSFFPFDSRVFFLPLAQPIFGCACVVGKKSCHMHS